MTCKIFLSSSEDKKALDFNGCSDKVKTHLSVASSIFKGPNDECYFMFSSLVTCSFSYSGNVDVSNKCTGGKEGDIR